MKSSLVFLICMVSIPIGFVIVLPPLAAFFRWWMTVWGF